MSSEFEKLRKQEIEDNSIIIYGKGTKLMPMCGFTARVIEVFKELGKPFAVVNVLQDESFRENFKAFTSWPTFPQIFIKGELVGGCDIVMEMFESRELQSLVEDL